MSEDKLYYKWTAFENDIIELIERLTKFKKRHYKIFGVPRGGTPIATALATALNMTLLEAPEEGCLVVDDIIDSGKTREFYNKYDFATLHLRYGSQFVYDGEVKTIYINGLKNKTWIVYPWETEENSIKDNIIRTIQYIGEDPNREGLKETPVRVTRSWNELFAGYKQKPEDIFTHFDSDGYDQIVLLKDIELYSMCEHHMLPFIGKAHIAYIPNKRVIGISKLARLLEIYARRLQIQERIGEEVTNALMKYLQPKAAACIIEATHLCMRMRGVSKQHSTMVTSSLKGVFLSEDPMGIAARSELMGLIK